jgi:hypothetical protein
LENRHNLSNDMNFTTDTGDRCVPVLIGLLCPLTGQAMCGLGSRCVWSPPNARRNSRTFVHALNVFVSFTLFLSLYKKHYDSVKASWTKRLLLFFETTCIWKKSVGSRLFPESHRRGRGIGLQIETGPEDGFDSLTAPEDRW